MVEGLLVSREDFDAWITPRDLMIQLAPLIGGMGPAAREIDARLKHGILTAVAASEHGIGGVREKISGLVLLDVAVWRDVHDIASPAHDFWLSGRLEVRRSLDHGRITRTFTYFDVRFYPHTVEMIPAIKLMRATNRAPTAIQTPPELARLSHLPQRPPAVPGGRVTAWYQALADADKALGLRALWAKAKAEVGPGVVRKQIEPFVAGRTTGPKGPRG